MTTRVCIVDYGSGNVRSVFNMMRIHVDDVVLSNRREDVDRATHLVLPGVGAFPSAMERIRSRLPLEQLETRVMRDGVPFLGICVGMQVLADEGTEFTTTPGLGWIPGRVARLPTDERLPHIGWNEVTFRDGDSMGRDVDGEDVYFVHSFAFEPSDPEDAIATTHHGATFCSAIRRDNVVGVQFHPEKSQTAGHRVLRNFLEIT